jgi:hypothetical protein
LAKRIAGRRFWQLNVSIISAWALNWGNWHVTAKDPAVEVAPRKPVMKHDASTKGFMAFRSCPLKRIVNILYYFAERITRNRWKDEAGKRDIRLNATFLV